MLLVLMQYRRVSFRQDLALSKGDMFLKTCMWLIHLDAPSVGQKNRTEGIFLYNFCIKVYLV